MDGTLYDEAIFISQCYVPISQCLAAAGCGDAEAIRRRMFLRWLERGSSYTRIFMEIIDGAHIADGTELERQCVELFRSFIPKLALTPRVEMLLEHIAAAYPIFLLSDGSARLQRAKFDALRLDRWFKDENLAISGQYGADFQKPGVGMIGKIEIMASGIAPNNVVYFGDRDIDTEFSRAAGFQHVRVHTMVRVSMDKK